jgi:hypothetical protein
MLALVAASIERWATEFRHLQRVLQQEATEDAHRMGGVSPLEDGYLSTPFFTLAWKRGIWLVLLLVAGNETTTTLIGDIVLDLIAHPDQLERLRTYQTIDLDATTKLAGEGFTRRWPGELKMSPEIKAIVDRKWKELGL